MPVLDEAAELLPQQAPLHAFDLDALVGPVRPRRAQPGETLETLDKADLAHAGAGLDQVQAAAPLVQPLPGKGRVLVFAFGHDSSGVTANYAAGPARPGINRLPVVDWRHVSG